MFWRLCILLVLITPHTTYTVSLSGLKAFLSANKLLCKTKAKTTAATSSTGTWHASDEAHKELQNGNIRQFIMHPSTWTAGGAATGSTILTNYFMKTKTCTTLLGRLPQFKHPRLKGAPELMLSCIVGAITFHSLHKPATALQEELEPIKKDEE